MPKASATSHPTIAIRLFTPTVAVARPDAEGESLAGPSDPLDRLGRFGPVGLRDVAPGLRGGVRGRPVPRWHAGAPPGGHQPGCEGRGRDRRDGIADLLPRLADQGDRPTEVRGALARARGRLRPRRPERLTVAPQLRPPSHRVHREPTAAAPRRRPRAAHDFGAGADRARPQRPHGRRRERPAYHAADWLGGQAAGLVRALRPYRDG